MKLTGMSYKMACYFAHCCLSSLLYKYWWNFFPSLLSGNIFALSPVIMIEQFSQSIGQGSKDPRQIFTVFSSSLLCSSKQHLSFHSLTHSHTCSHKQKEKGFRLIWFHPSSFGILGCIWMHFENFYGDKNLVLLSTLNIAVFFFSFISSRIFMSFDYKTMLLYGGMA